MIRETGSRGSRMAQKRRTRVVQTEGIKNLWKSLFAKKWKYFYVFRHFPCGCRFFFNQILLRGHRHGIAVPPRNYTAAMLQVTNICSKQAIVQAKFIFLSKYLYIWFFFCNFAPDLFGRVCVYTWDKRESSIFQSAQDESWGWKKRNPITWRIRGYRD